MCYCNKNDGELSASTADLREKIAKAHRMTTQREISESTLSMLEDVHQEFLQDYEETSFAGLAASKEEAALVNIASILLNVDSALTK